MNKITTVVFSILLCSFLHSELSAQSGIETPMTHSNPTTVASGPLAPEILPVIGVLTEYERGSIKYNGGVASNLGGNNTDNHGESQSGRSAEALFQEIDGDSNSGGKDLPTLALDGLKLFPVPVVSNLNLEIDINADVTVQLYDVLGRLLLEQTIFNVRKHSIDFAAFNNGIYLLRVTAGEESVTRKFEVYR